MNEQIKELVEEVIIDSLNAVTNLEVGSELRASTVEEIVKLNKIIQEEDKASQDKMLMLTDNKRKKSETVFKTSEKILDVALGVAGIIIPLAFYKTYMDQGFEFEKTGTYCSGTFKNLISRVNPANVFKK